MNYVPLGLIYMFGVSLKTINFGRYSWKHGNKRGAIGLWIYALLTVALPLLVWLRP